MMTTRKVQFKTLSPLKLVSVLLLGAFMSGPMAIAEHLGDDADHDGLQRRPDPHEALRQHDRLRIDMERLGISAEPEHAYVGPSLELVGRGERLLPNATTDVWTHKKFSYIGTFNEPCGDGTGANGSGIRIFDVKRPENATEIDPIPSVLGSRSNDVKVANLHSGRILVHSNEPCAGGPGGFGQRAT